MAEESGQQRTQRATPRRRSQARQKGQVPRSQELTTAAMMLAVAGGFLVFGGYMLDALAGVMRHGLSYRRAQVFSEGAMAISFAERIGEALWGVAPLLGLVLVAAVAAPIAVGGWNFTTQPLGFNLSRLDPINGMKRVFSWQGGVEVLKALAKFAIVASVAAWLLHRSLPELMSLGNQNVGQGLMQTGHILAWSLLTLSASLLLIAAVDVPFQLWNYNRQLRMSRQEVTDEHKDTEGRPEVKRRIRRAQMEMSRRRMMAEVPKADVIVTNPTHYAVALRYDQHSNRAPLVVAKGSDLVAAQIRRIAQEFRVPFVSAPPLARAIYHSTELGDEIPQGLYLAVAKVLAYVYQLRHAPGYVAPPTGDDLPIPPDLQRSH
jgi:flagellar biosynthetic protein FlhB